MALKLSFPALIYVKLDSSTLGCSSDDRHAVSQVSRELHSLEGLYVLQEDFSLIPLVDYHNPFPDERRLSKIQIGESVQRLDYLCSEREARVVVPLHFPKANESLYLEIARRSGEYFMHLQRAA